MDKMLVDTKHLTVYLSTLQVGVGIIFVTEYKELHIMFGIFEIIIR